MEVRESFNVFLSLVFLCASSLISTDLHAAETDGFTKRYDGIKDGMPLLNAEIRKRIVLSISELNKTSRKTKVCDWKELDSKLGERLRRPIVGQIESLVNSSGNFPKFSFPLAESVYKTLPSITFMPIYVGNFLGITFGNQIGHDGLVIGTDKLGHFLDEGYYYYTAVHEWGYTFEEALDFGSYLENTFDGKWTSGVYSYADLAANYEGHRFWENALGIPGKGRSSKYFYCRDGDWHIKRQFDLADYLNEAWDEGMNCNEFRSEDMKLAVDEQIKGLELKNGKRFACPVFPDRVPQMIKRYGAYAKKILNSKIFELAQENQ